MGKRVTGQVVRAKLESEGKGGQMTTPESQDREEAGQREEEGAASPRSTPLLPSPGAAGHRWIAVLAFLAAAAALVWRCA
jgi:hypothetical protein